MATRRNPTNPDTTAWSLSEPQRTAVDQLVVGRNLQDTADTLGVTRQTVSEWLHHHAGFQAALNQRRQELWQELTEQLRGLASAALVVLQQELERENRLQAAVHILKACGLYGSLAAPTGETDPQAIALAMKLKADDRSHAAEDTAITIQRRHFDRMLAAMAADPIGPGLP